ncbi:MAG: IPT/TIG domain-containing protein [Saprospiraceae bacterium]
MKTIIVKSLLFFLLIFGCTKEDFEKRDYPRLETNAVTNVSAEGAVFNATIQAAKNTPLIDHGFLWRIKIRTFGDADIELEPVNAAPEFNKISLGAKANLENFEAMIDYALLPDTPYLVRSYIQTADHIIYGNTVIFNSKGSKLNPEISDFAPKVGTGGDTVVITGNNFSQVTKENNVFFDTYTSRIIKANRTSITCIVPLNILATNVKISVSTLNKPPVFTKEDFILAKPSITGFAPQQGTYRDIITIKGSGFSGTLPINIVKFGDAQAEVINASFTELVVRVPDAINVPAAPIQVTVFGRTVLTPTNFTLYPPEIQSVEPNEVFIGENLTVRGKYFSPIGGYNSIYLDTEAIPSYSSGSSTFISITIPNDKQLSRNPRIGVTTLGKLVYSNKTIKILGWLRRAAMPVARESMVSFSIGNKGYIGLGKEEGYNDFWQYDPSSSRWENIAAFPGKSRYKAINFVIGNSAYVGAGIKTHSEDSTYQDFWRYDSNVDNWTRISDFPTLIPTGSFGFAVNGKGYICLAENPASIWEYVAATNTWIKRAEVNLPSNGINTRPYAGAVLNGKVHIFTNAQPNGLYIFDPGTNTLTKQSDVYQSYEFREIPAVFNIEGNTYFLLPDNLYLKQYEPLTGSINATIFPTYMGNTLGYRDKFIWFAIGKDIYIGSGFESVAGTGYSLQNDLWEYRFDE